MRKLLGLVLFSFISAFPQELPIFPPPRQISILPKKHSLQLPLKIAFHPQLKRPADLLAKELKTIFGEKAVSEKGKTIVSLKLNPQSLRKEEEYSVEIASNKITLTSHDEQGAFWSVYSLLQILSSDLLRLTPNGWSLPGIKVRDYPEDNFRAFMIQGAWTKSIDDFKLAIKLLARLKVRYVAIEFGPQVVLGLDPSMARGIRLSKAQAKEIVDYARSLGLEPIGYLNLLAHLERAYEKFPYTAHGGILIQNEEVYDKFVFPILDEMLDVYEPIKFFHCGMDEAWELFSWLSSQGYDCAQLLARHINKINDYLKQKGIKMIIWHDMLFSPDLEKEIGAPIGPANGGPPQNTAKALELISKDVILDYWFYDPLDSYPALDWLRKKGFQVWASPWQTPFSFTLYARKSQTPTLGTIWADPPYCFTSHSLAPVPALYAWATWNPETAPGGRVPEKDISSRALKFTENLLWGRCKLTYPSQTLLLRCREKKLISLSLPKDVGMAPEQHYGIPFDFASPLLIPPLKGKSKILENPKEAKFVLLPGKRIVIDGVNRGRGEDELILYTPPRERTGTNIYGVEVAVSSEGEVCDISDYGSGNMLIPPQGFVLSAHLGPKGEKANALRRLKQGDRIGILDKEGNFIGGFTREILIAELPKGLRLPIDGVNRERGEDELILYTPGFNEGRTGTNQWGIEVVIVEGKVREVRNWIGDAQIPFNGFVLSAHWGPSSSKAKALSELKVGDSVKVLIPTEEGEMTYEEAMRRGSWEVEINKKCANLFLVTATQLSGRMGEPLGSFEIEYSDGSVESIPIRYGIEALPLQGMELPLPEKGKAWLIQREGEVQRFLVREWDNPKLNIPITRLRFKPVIEGLKADISICGITIGIR